SLHCSRINMMQCTFRTTYYSVLHFVPVLPDYINVGQIENVGFVAWTQLNGGAHGVVRGVSSSAFQFRQAQQVIRLGQFGIPINDGLQSLLHVGKALDGLTGYFCLAELEDGKVKMHPGIVRITLRCLSKL